MRLRFTAGAVAEVNDIHAYVSARNPQAADGVVARIDHAIESLMQFPARGRAGRVRGTRELVVPASSYIVVYAVSDETIDVLAVRHDARAWPSSFSV